MVATRTPYNGRNVDQMPILLSRGEVPLSTAGLMQHRALLIDELGDVSVYTSDLVAYGDKKRSDEIKMILAVDNKGILTEHGRATLGLIAPNRNRVAGAINIRNEYEGLNGSGIIPISRKDLKKYGINGDLTQAQVLAHPIWRALLRHPDAVPAEFAYDNKFMEEAVGRTFSEMNKRHEYTEGMGVYPADAQNVPTLRAWCVLRLRRGSYAGGRDFLGSVTAVPGSE